MLKTAWFIARHDALHMLREKETLVWLLVMPVVFMFFIGKATGGFGKTNTAKDELALITNDDGFLVERIEGRLRENNYEVRRVASAAEATGSARVLALPDDFTRAVLAGERAKVVLTREESGLGADYDKVRVARAIYTTLADVVSATLAGGDVSRQSLIALDSMPRMLTIASKPSGKRKVIPSGFEQAIPGILVMFTLIALLTSGAVLLVIERRAGLLRRLSYTPLPRSGIILGKWLGKLILGLTQCSFAMGAGSILFGMNWGTSLPMVVLVVLAWAFFCASAGLLLGSLAQTEGQAVGFGVLTTNVLAALGGCWWPIEVAPAWMQDLAKLLPTGWAMAAMHRLISFQDGAASAIPHTLALFTGALVLGFLAKQKFRFV